MKLEKFSIHTTEEERKLINLYYKNSRKKNKTVKKKPLINKLKENNKKAKTFSKKLRRRSTKAEKILMKRFDEDGMIYSFQHYFYSRDFCYIVDFWFKNLHGKPICIELDGRHHKNKDVLEYDKKRSNTLIKRRGVFVLRFDNNEIYRDLDRVVEQIYSFSPRFIDLLPEYNQL